MQFPQRNRPPLAGGSRGAGARAVGVAARPVRAVRSAALLAVVIAALAGPPAAAAHAELVGSSPAAGSELRTSPTAVITTFSEGINPKLSRLSVTGPGQRAVPGRVSAIGTTRLELRPRRPLRRGVYDVRWRSVSTDDGHTLQGTYRFGVGAAAPGGAGSAAYDPVSGAGWLRVLLRGLLDAGMLAFCGGVLCAALLDRGRPPGAWLLPDPTADAAAARAARVWRGTILVGVGALAAGVASTLAATVHAGGGGLSGSALHAFLLSNVSGVARLALLAALALAAGAAALRRAPAAGGLAILALAALTLSGHAYAARLRGVAIAGDLVHLVAGAIWIGGIAHLAAVWLPPGVGARRRRQAITHVLPRFGRIALPAFAAAVVGGIVEAVIQVGSVPALWEHGYGRVLLIKAALVGLVALGSYLHALRIRPRLLRAAGPEAGGLERRHWRLVRGEAIVAAMIPLAAALLIAYPPPGGGSAAGPSSSLAGLAGTRPPPGTAAPDQVSVAAEAGPDIIAAWITARPGQITAQIHTLSRLEQPIATTPSIDGATVTGACGKGCANVRIPAATREISVSISCNGRRYTAPLPIPPRTRTGALARRLLHRVETAQVKLRSAVVHETLAAGPTTPNVTTYRILAPNRMASRSSRAGKPIGDEIIIGTRQWSRNPGQRRWHRSLYGGGQRFTAASYLGWWISSATFPRLLDLHRSGGRQIADIATVNDTAPSQPVWLRLKLDITHRHLLHLRMITTAHFMTQRWGAFNAPQRIRAPGN